MTLDEAIERNRARNKYQYPTRLPLPRYKAWETLTDAMAHIDAHGTVIEPSVKHFSEPGDWEALIVLRETRSSLCTPR